MKNWDLIIFNPIVIFISIGLILFFAIKEKVNKRQVSTYIEILLFWIGLSFLLKFTTSEVSMTFNSVSSSMYLTIIILSSLFFAMIFKPLATYITTKIKGRKLWLWVGYSTALLAGVILAVAKIAHLDMTYVLIFVSLLIGFSLSNNTLHVLYVNEQFFYKIHPIGSTWLVISIILYSTYIGNYWFDLNDVIINGNSALISFVAIALIAIAFALSFLSKENKNMVGSFEEVIRQKLGEKDLLPTVILAVSSFLIAIVASLGNSTITKLFLSLQWVHNGVSNERIDTGLRLFDYAFTIPSAILSYAIYKYIFKSVGFKLTLLINLFIIFIVYTVFAFSHVPELDLVLNLFSGIAFAQIIYNLFSLSIMWNYRLDGVPVSGIVSGSAYAGYFTVSVLQESVISNKVGIFKEIGSVEQLLSQRENIINNSYDYYFKEINNIFTITMCLAALISLIVILMIYFKSRIILMEWRNYKNATNAWKQILKQKVMQQTKSKIEM